MSVSENHQGESSESAHTQVENDEIGQKSVLEGVSFYQPPFDSVSLSVSEASLP